MWLLQLGIATATWTKKKKKLSEIQMASLSPPTSSAGRRSSGGLHNWWQLKDALSTTSLEVRAQTRKLQHTFFRRNIQL